MIVIDASAFLELLLRTPAGVRAESALISDVAVAPALLDAEVLHRLLGFEKSDVLSDDEVDVMVQLLAGAAVQRLDHRPLLSVARHMGGALSGYDALYAAAARSLDATLVTGDRRLARTAAEQFGLDVVDIT